MDVAGVALPLVELGHERQRAALLRRDLLGAGLVQRVLVGRGQGVLVAQRDLLLAQVALALAGLDPHPRAGHPGADPPQHRLDRAGAEHGVVDVVVGCRLEVAVPRAPGLLVGRPEQQELELGADVGRPAALGEPVELAAQHLPRRGGDRRPVRPGQVGEHAHRAGVPRDPADRREVGDEGHVAVAAVPRGRGVAADGVHVDVDGEQVVAALGGVRQHLVEEVVGVGALAREPALHVGHGEHDGVDGAGGDLAGELGEVEAAGQPPRPARRLPRAHTAASSRSMAASSSAVPCTFGPVNHFRAEANQYTVA